MKKLNFLIIILLAALITDYGLRITIYESYAQDPNQLARLSDQILQAKSNSELYPLFEELKGLYFKENKYSEFAAFLGSLKDKKQSLAPFSDYYIAQARYQQLRYLEETKSWDEYFANGNAYRDQITSSVQKAIDSSDAKEPLNIYARTLKWQFYKGQQDTVLAESSLSELVNSVSEYAKEAQDPGPIKYAADQLSAGEEKPRAAQLYQLYVSRLSATVKDEQALKDIADGFYKEANLEVSEAVYDAYIERISQTYSKEQLIPVLTDIAKKFYAQSTGLKDGLYAEKIFARLEQIGGMEAFDEELLYLRAFNLEKLKSYPRARDLYQELLKRFPQTLHADEASFKIAAIHTYILRDSKTGREYFEKLSAKEPPSPQAISSIYHLGLISHWEGDITKAAEYYNSLTARAKEAFGDTLALTQARLKEIEEGKPIEYNLKTFLDLSLKDEYDMFDTTKIDLGASLYRVNKEDKLDIFATPHIGQTGCMQIEIEYLWSGDLGTAEPGAKEVSFPTSYTQPGTKVLNIVVVSPSGYIDRNMEMIDVD